jgi:hypothetical protein
LILNEFRFPVFRACLSFDFAGETGKKSVLIKRFWGTIRPAMVREKRNSGSFDAGLQREKTN